MVDPAQLQKKHQPNPCPDESKCCFYRPSDQPSCCKCLNDKKSSPFSCLAICFIVIAYNVLGGFLFLALEGNIFTEESAVAASKPNLSSGISQSLGMSYELRSKTVEKLWSITEDLNILYKENWTKLAAKELMEFQRVLLKGARGGEGEGAGEGEEPRDTHRWTFSTSFLYALTLITTIGPGGAGARSWWGRCAALLYAAGGAPLVLLYLAAAARALRRLLPARRPRRPTRAPHAYASPFQAALNAAAVSAQCGCGGGCGHGRAGGAPAALAPLVLCAYVALGGALFHATERWSVLDACYFSVSALATVGLGGLTPGAYARTLSARHEDLAVAVCCAYIFVGIAVVALCFNLIRERLAVSLRGLAAVRSATTDDVAVHRPATVEDSAS